MLPELRLRLIRVVAVLFICLLGTAARASTHVTVDLVEAEAGLVLRIRGLDPSVVEVREVDEKKDRAYLFVSDHKAAVQKLFGGKRHRLDYAQIGTHGEDLVIRFQQHYQYKGRVTQFLQRQIVDGGFDIYIYDEAVPAAPPPAPAATQSSLAVLEKALAKDPVRTEPKVAPVDDREDEALAESDPVILNDEQEAPVAVAAAAETEAKAEPEEEQADIFAGTEEAVPPTATQSPARPLIPVFAGLAALAFGALVLLRKRMGPKLRSELDVDVVSRVAIGPKQQIVHVRTAGRDLLLGVTEHQISLLTPIGGDLTPAPHVPHIAPASNEPLLSPSGPSIPAVKPAKENPSQARIDAFKRRLREALGAEVRGVGNDSGDEGGSGELPPHLAILQQQRDPQWAQREDVV